MVISRELRIDPYTILGYVQIEWLHRWDGSYLGDLARDPSAVAAGLRELAEDPKALVELAELAG